MTFKNILRTNTNKIQICNMYACWVALVETFEKNCVNPFSNPIQEACDQLVTLKVEPKAACDPENCFEILP